MITAPLSVSELDNRVECALRRGLTNLEQSQGPEGSWPCDYSGPMFLLPMYVALAYASGRLDSDPRRDSMRRYLLWGMHADGGIGLHSEDPRGSMFVTATSYVALRLLGLAANDEHAVRMRRWLHDHGSPLGAAPWGKLVLAILGLYGWEGLHPVQPELWLLPSSAPMHPSRLWCHCRQVYLPMAWLYGRRATVPLDPLLSELRSELYAQPYERINFRKHKDTLAKTDAYRPSTKLLRLTNRALAGLEATVPRALRQRALDEVFHHIDYEDRATNFIDIGPVNKVLNSFVRWFRAPGSSEFAQAMAACDVYLWQGANGTSMRGYNGSELWDVAFTLQAIEATSLEHEFPTVVERAYAFVRDNQILEDPPELERHYRHRSRGGWPFSNRPHGWPISDCTAEGLKCALKWRGRFTPTIPDVLLGESIEVLLSFQNEDGGFGTYENKRGPDWLEQLNPSHVFGEIMVDYSHVECTSACLQALDAARSIATLAQKAAINLAMKRGERYLRERQLADGSFEGAWAVCFTYGTWFGVSGLLAAGVAPSDPAIRRACAFLLSHQRADGGWGEHGDSCRERRYIEAPTTMAAQTSWALSTLVRARDPDRAAQDRAVEALLTRQLADGSYAQEALVGVFNRTCLIDYDNYRNIFPLWALGEWRQNVQPR
jgi:squalene/oxidosqualene cyclase-like protein